ncbi:MAG: RNA polymerase sigma factor [Rikenellaceae bacterium]
MVNEERIIELIEDPQTCYEGFQLLVENYQKAIYWHIRRLVVNHEDAEDIMQESLIKIYRYIYSFKGESSLKTWIYRVVTNEVIRHCSRKRLTMESYDEKSRLVTMFRAENHVDFSSAEHKLHLAILSLPEKQRIIFNMRHFEDMSYEQISKVMGCSIATLRTNYHYASEKIKNYIVKSVK